MEVIVKIAQFLLSLSILIILHELGHFVFAKLFKTRVEKFYLFFNPWFSLFKVKKGETEYGLGWLPLGGYVKISGMIDESMDKEQLKKPPQPYEFRSKPAWQRLLIMLGGVLVNFILALGIYSITLYIWGERYLPNKNVTNGIMVTDSIGYELGLKDGDKIVALDNKEIEDFYDITVHIVLNDINTIQVNRNDSLFEIAIPDDFVTKLLNKKSFIYVRIPFIIADFTKESPAKKAGFMKGDKIIKLNDLDIEFYDQFKRKLPDYKFEKIIVSVLRDNKEIEIPIVVPESGVIGVYPDEILSKFFTLRTVKYGFWEAIPAGIKKGFGTLKDYLKQFKLIFSRKTKGYKSIGGFITIGSIFPGVWDWQAFWILTAFLSIILAVLNILPIPALDGGHVLFLLFEMVTGRKPGDKFLEYAQIVGMILLLTLLLYANGNDIVKLFKKILYVIFFIHL